MVSRAETIERTILRRLSSVGQDAAAHAAGVDESTISRLKGADTRMNLAAIARMLDCLGLKVVGVDRVCVLKEEYLMMTRIVSRALANQQTAESLLFEDPE